MQEAKKDLVKYGFAGGGTIYELGSNADMVLFFECIEYNVLPKYPNEDFSVITDRLYRRYLRLEELDEAILKMQFIENVCESLPRDAIDWGNAEEGFVTCLDIYEKTLKDIFKKYFSAFYKCVNGAKYTYEHTNDKIYLEVKVVPTHIAFNIYYKSIPLSEFEALSINDRPFWKCPLSDYKHWSIRKGDIYKFRFTTANIIKYKNKFIDKIAKRMLETPSFLSEDTIRQIIVDISSQTINKAQEDEIKKSIVEKSNGIVQFNNIIFEVSQK